MSEDKEIKSREKLEVLSETLIAVGVLLLIIAALNKIIASNRGTAALSPTIFIKAFTTNESIT